MMQESIEGEAVKGALPTSAEEVKADWERLTASPLLPQYRPCAASTVTASSRQGQDSMTVWKACRLSAVQPYIAPWARFCEIAERW